jgi:hypothetical protein
MHDFPMRNILSWIAVLPVAFIASSAVTLALGYLGGRLRASTGESIGNVFEWFVFLIRGILFVAVGVLLAPTARLAVAIVLATIQILACVSPVGKPSCRLATVIGAAASLLYFITA